MLIGAGVLSLLLAASWLLAFHVGFGERADASVFNVFLGHHAYKSWRFVQLASLPTYLLLCLVPIGIALGRRRFVLAATVAAILIGASGVALALKLLVSRAHPQGLINHAALGTGVWPSGHATAAAALALCLVIVSPVRLRPYAALVGILYVLGISYSVVTLAWHYPSDVIGGILVASIVALLGVAGCRLAETSLAQIRLKRAQGPSGHPVAAGVPQRLAVAVDAAAEDE